MAKPRTLVFLHGFMGRGSDWDPIIARLDVRHSTLAPDIGKDLPPCIRQPPPVLVGYSMGARMAMYQAVDDPDSVRALILESGMPGLESDTEKTLRIQQDRLRVKRLKEVGIRNFLEEWYAQPLFASLQHHPQILSKLIEARAELDPDQVAEQLLGTSLAGKPNCWPELANLSMPVLALAGGLDHKYAAVAERIASLCPMGQSKIIENAGHNVHLEQPEAYVAAIEEFINELGDD